MKLQDKFVEEMLNAGYPFNEVTEFADWHLQNLLPLEQNIKNFKQWLNN